MVARSVTAFAALVLLGSASPVLAQSIDPARVLAGTTHARSSHARSSHGFADRTARIGSIMGADVAAAAPLHLPTKPVWIRPARREADAAAALR